MIHEDDDSIYSVYRRVTFWFFLTAQSLFCSSFSFFLSLGDVSKEV
jgi:hypothetical protein